MAEKEEFFKRIDAAKVRLDALRPLEPEREQRLMQKFRLWWTYHSNAIEGNSLTQGETEMFLMEGLTAKGKPLKDHLDLRGHSNAINYLLAFVRDKEVLTEASIRKLHKVLLVEAYQVQAITPDGQPTMKTVALGRYKEQPNHVRTPTGEIYYYATPESTPAQMHALMSWYRAEIEGGKMHPVEVATRFHHQFTAIHPFDDGNGRMSRLLMNLLLMQAGYPPVVIRLSERNQYLAGLRRADREEYDDFIDFVAQHVAESLELSFRAADGGEIDDPADIEKEIALEVLRLKHIAELKTLTQETQQQVFEKNLDPLFTEITRLITPLCELFKEGIVSVEGEHMLWRGIYGERGHFSERLPLLKTARIPRGKLSNDENLRTTKRLIETLELELALQSFNKIRFESFSLSARLEFAFEENRYRMTLPFLDPPIALERFYLEHLRKTEIEEIAQKVVRFFLDGIRKNTGGPS